MLIEKARPGTKVELIRGKGGVFDIRVDGRLAYSKHRTDRYPTDEEIIRIVK